jgi:hypothetical protein
MAQQTAVDWYAQALRKCLMGTVPCDPIQTLEQANQMFKEQIAEAYRKGVEEDVYNNPLKTGNEYYNETYGK